jgi:hypothetical protein
MAAVAAATAAVAGATAAVVAVTAVVVAEAAADVATAASGAAGKTARSRASSIFHVRSSILPTRFPRAGDRCVFIFEARGGIFICEPEP